MKTNTYSSDSFFQFPLLPLLLLLLAPSAQLSSANTVSGKGCTFDEFARDDRIESWEFQTKLPYSKLKIPFEQLALKAGEDLKSVALTHPQLEIAFHRHSRVSKTLAQDSWSLTTYDGRELYPDDQQAPHQFPWTDGYMRKRQAIYFDDPKDTYEPENDTCPYNFHNTDLTIKMRSIILGEFSPENISGAFPAEVPSTHRHVRSTARLKTSIEHDVYCNAQNLQYKAAYWPIYMHQRTSNLEDIAEYVPGLADALQLPACAPLPYRSSKFQRVAIWQMEVNGVAVRATLTVEYKSQAKAFTALVTGEAGEVSLRIFRDNITAALGGKFSYRPVEELALVIREMHNKGWDYLKPGHPEELTYDDLIEAGDQARWDSTWPSCADPAFA